MDEKLYSRQLYVMGHEAQRRMMASHGVLIGVSGLGAEVAKNCILAGISSITLVDPCAPTAYDLGGNFYLTESDVGDTKGRAELSREKLGELNQYVNVTVAEGVRSLTMADKDGILALNLADGVMTSTALDDCFDSRIELISREAMDVDALQAQLLEALAA